MNLETQTEMMAEMMAPMNRELMAAQSLFPLDLHCPGRARDVLSWCSEYGAKILYPGHSDYPFVAGHLERLPAFFSYIGSTPWKLGSGLAIVGSREPTRGSVRWLETYLPDFLRQTNAVVMSGGARGIDQTAHLLALRSGRPTVVFLPSGLAQPYPSEWRDWQKEVVAAGGAIVSTYSPFQEIRRSHFEERNRLIAAVGRMLFVVEARRRSGSSMTARMAVQLDRTVCVLPAAPGDPRTAGTVDLLFDGAYPIRDGSDLAALFGISLVNATPGAS